MHGKSLTLRLATVLVASLVAMGSAWAEDGDRLADQSHLFEIGMYGGAFYASDSHQFFDDQRFGHQRLRDWSPEVGLRLAYLPLSWIGAELETGAIISETVGNSDATLYTVRGHLLLQYPCWIAPFVVAGGGMMAVDSAVLGNDIDGSVHYGGGLKWYATRDFIVRVDGRHVMTDSLGSGIAHNFEALLGLSLNFGWAEPVPEPPSDRDGDGVIDDEDQCPDEAGVAPTGCPKAPVDTDGDGLPDDKDKCPNQPANTPDGCPAPEDTDGDGLTDDIDMCPKQAAKTPDGCPPKDSDGDGFTDDKDTCPEKPETVNGFQDDDGCPDEVPDEVKKFSGNIKGILFNLGKASIRASSFPLLDNAVEVLQQYPDIKLLIEGHSDSQGNKKYNMKLSEKRANAVRDYLIGKGVAADRLTTAGIGPERPIASNATRTGRAQNRRIEFTVVK